MDNVAATRTSLGSGNGVGSGEGTRETRTLTAVQDVAEKLKSNVDGDVWFSTYRPGLQLRLLKMSRMALVEAQERIQEPKIPEVHIEDDDRWEPNPNDPAYKRQLQDYLYELQVIIISTCVALGTETIMIPKGVDAPEDTDWLDRLSVTGIKVPEGRWARYVAWLRLYALDETEIGDLVRAVQRYNGFIREADVESAIERFPSEQTRDTDRTVRVSQGSEQRDND